MDNAYSVVKMLSQDFLKSQKPGVYAGFKRFVDYSHSIVATGFSLISHSTRFTPGILTI